jgi:hypothetical protein
MAKIFVSYRRADADTEAGRIADWLDRHFGEDEVFMDIDAIAPGAAFRSVIGETIAEIDALVAVIGRSWVDITDEEGRRRLDDPNDVLRLEVASALERGVLVIPVCVQGASVPKQEQLPAELQPLVERNALSLSNTNWRPGMDRLIAALDGRSRSSGGSPGAAPFATAVAGAALLLVGLFIKSGPSHETLLHPRFGGVVNFHDSSLLWRLAGVVSALPTIGLAALAVLGASWAGSRRPLALGLLSATGIQAFAYYAGVLTKPHRFAAGYVVPLVGALLVLGAAWLLRTHLSTAHTLDQRTRIVAALGGVAMLVGMSIAFNSGGTDGRYKSTVLDSGHVERWDALFVALLVLLVALTPVARRRSFAAGLLTACGVGIGLVWLRFAVVPLIEIREVATPAAGGYVGLGGACLVAYAGIAAQRAAVRVGAVAGQTGGVIGTGRA